MGVPVHALRIGQTFATSRAELGEVLGYLESGSINFHRVADQRGGLGESHCEKPAWNRACLRAPS